MTNEELIAKAIEEVRRCSRSPLEIDPAELPKPTVEDVALVTFKPEGKWQAIRFFLNRETGEFVGGEFVPRDKSGSA